MLAKFISLAGLVVKQSRSWDTIFGGADITIGWKAGFDVTTGAVARVGRPTEKSGGATPGIIRWKLGGRCICGICNQAGTC
jgi:hypothetical protein